jgi:HD-like signal output (HDOD) protein
MTMIEEPLVDLDAWVEFFSAAVLPVFRHTGQELEGRRQTAEMVNGRVLAGIILHDPLMVLRVLAYIQNHRLKRQQTDITTIERAIIMIGIDPFFRDFQGLPLIEDHLQSYPRALLGLLKVANRSRRAAHWAREWAIIRHDLNVDEITVATLVNDVAEILMWLFAPKLALAVRDAQIEQPHRRSVSIQEEIYGVPLFEIKRALAKVWSLPELLTMLMDGKFEDNPRVRSVQLAVDLARHSANGWDDPALPDDIRWVGELLQADQSSVIRSLNLDAASSELLTKMLDLSLLKSAEGA